MDIYLEHLRVLEHIYCIYYIYIMYIYIYHVLQICWWSMFCFRLGKISPPAGSHRHFAPKRAKRCTSAETSMDFSHESDAKMVRGLMWLHLHFIFHNDMGVGVFFGDFEMWIEATIQRWRNNGVTTQFSGDLFSSPQFWGQIDRTVGYRRPDPRSKWNHDWEVMQNNTAFRIIVGVILAIPLKL